VDPGAAPVGYAMVTAPVFPAEILLPDDLELRRCYLFSRFHGTGTGQQMIDASIAWARSRRASRLLLGVHPENHRALSFYHRNGFEQIGKRTFHLGSATFEDPVLALTL
jgi:GNAT superfamily N-acetyltransferase